MSGGFFVVVAIIITVGTIILFPPRVFKYTPEPTSAPVLPPRLTQDDIDRTLNEARKDLGLEVKLPKSTSSYYSPRPIIEYKPPDYFKVTQEVVTDPGTGKRRAILTWTTPSGAVHGWSEEVQLLDYRRVTY